MYIIVLPNGIRSYFLFRGRVRNGMPRVCFYFCSTERNSELFSLPLECSEGNSERYLLFFVQRNGIPSCFLFRGRVRDGIPRVFCSGIPSEITICSVDSVFRGIIFLSEIPNPNYPHYLPFFMSAVKRPIMTTYYANDPFNQ